MGQRHGKEGQRHGGWGMGKRIGDTGETNGLCS
jgi:hypothetical protein